MIKFNFAHLCDDVYLLQNGTPAVVGIFSGIVAEGKPIIRRKVALILNFTPNDRETHTVRVVLKNPSGAKVKESTEKEIGSPKGQDENLGFILDFYNIKFEEEGQYNFEIFIDKNLAETIPLKFSVKKG